MRKIVLLVILVLPACEVPAQLSSKEVKIIAGLQRELTGDLQKDTLHTSVSAAIVLIKEESLRKMVEPSRASRNYGMAMMIMRDRELTMIGHDGLDPGYTSQLSIDPYTGNAVILLRNCRPGITDLVGATRDVLSRL